MEKKTVIAGVHGPVPMEENTRRFIGSEPVEVPMSAYYIRRMAEGELVEPAAKFLDDQADKKAALDQMLASVTSKKGK